MSACHHDSISNASSRRPNDRFGTHQIDDTGGSSLLIGRLGEVEEALAGLARPCGIVVGDLGFFAAQIAVQVLGRDGLIAKPEEFLGETQTPDRIWSAWDLDHCRDVVPRATGDVLDETRGFIAQDTFSDGLLIVRHDGGIHRSGRDRFNHIRLRGKGLRYGGRSSSLAAHWGHLRLHVVLGHRSYRRGWLGRRGSGRWCGHTIYGLLSFGHFDDRTTINRSRRKGRIRPAPTNAEVFGRRREPRSIKATTSRREDGLNKG